MKKIEFDIPVITNFPKTPALQEGAMAHSKPFVAKSDHQEPLGFPGELVDDWHDKAPGNRNCESDIHLVEQQNGVVLDHRVELWALTKCSSENLDEQCIERKRAARAFS